MCRVEAASQSNKKQSEETGLALSRRKRTKKQAPPISPRTRLADICRSCRPMAASSILSRRRFPLSLLRRACPTPSNWSARLSQTLSGRDFLSRTDPSSLPRKPASRRGFWSCCAACHTLKPAQARQHRRTTTRQASAVHFRRAAPAQRDCLERRAGETASEPTPKREDKGKNTISCSPSGRERPIWARY